MLLYRGTFGSVCQQRERAVRIASPAAVTALRLRRCGALVVVRCSSARASCPRTSCLCLQFPLQLVQVRRPVVAVAWTLVAPDPCVRAVRLERPPHPPHLSPLAMAAELRDKILDALLVEVAHELPDGCGRDRDGGRLHLPLQSVQRAVQREKVQKEANQAPLLRHLCPLLGRIATERTPTSWPCCRSRGRAACQRSVPPGYSPHPRDQMRHRYAYPVDGYCSCPCLSMPRGAGGAVTDFGCRPASFPPSGNDERVRARALHGALQQRASCQ